MRFNKDDGNKTLLGNQRLGSDWVGRSSVEKGAGGSKASVREGCIVSAEKFVQ